MRTIRWFTFVLVLALVAGCNLPRSGSPPITPGVDTNLVGTAAAMTAAAIMTQSAGSAVVPTLAFTDTLQPTNTTQPSDTPQPTATNTQPATATQIPCNWASFVQDVTVPDGTEKDPNVDFTKTWRLKNKGSCTWTSGYSLIFDHGDRMNAPDSVQLTTGTVPPGGTVDVSVSLKAPGSAGTYQGFFKLRSSDNNIFGVNQNAQDPFWVKIKVGSAPAAASGPDLRVTGMDFSQNPPKQGVEFTVTVQVKNKGDAPAGAFAVQWWSSWAKVGCDWAVTSLAVNEEKTLTCQYTYGGWATYQIKAVVDPANTVVESNETNNIRETSYTVQH